MNEMLVKYLEEIKEPKVSELSGRAYFLVALINNSFNVPRRSSFTLKYFLNL